MKGRILVIRGGAIGDFILTLPVLGALRSAFPGAGLTVLGYPHIAGLALAGGLADEVHAIEARGLAAFFNPGSPPPPEVAAFFARFDIILSFLYDPDGFFQQSVARCSRAQFIAGPHRPDEAQSVHATEVFLKPLERLAIFEVDPCPRLRLEAVGRGAAGNLRSDEGGGQGTARPAGPPPTLAVHPGSGSEQKNWPERCWAELLERLASGTRWHLLLVGGEAEGERLDRLAGIWPADRLSVARSLPLVELARRLTECRAFAGHDSGITHLAAALGLPGVVFWGASNQAVWRPRSETFRILCGAGGLSNLEVGGVESAIRALLPA